MGEIKSEGLEKTEEVGKSELFSNLERIEDDGVFKSDISKEEADDIYASVIYERMTVEMKGKIVTETDEESPESELFSNLERIEDDIGFKNDIQKDGGEITNAGPNSMEFRNYYEEIKDDYSEKSREEVYAELSDEYEYLEEWLHRSGDEWGIDLATYNEMRCVEDNGDVTAEIDDDDDSYDPYYD